MPLTIYRAQDFDTTHERIALQEFEQKLENEFGKRDDTTILIENYTCEGNQIDATIIKNDAIIILEFKNYGGAIIFSENGDWTADGSTISGGSRNPSQQVRACKYGLLKFLREHEEQLLVQKREVNWGHISGIVVFHQHIQFDSTSINHPLAAWFHVTDLDSSIKKISNITSTGIHLILAEMQKIPELLGIRATSHEQPEAVPLPLLVPVDTAPIAVEIPTITPKPLKPRPQATTQEGKILDYFLRCIELTDIKSSYVRETKKVKWCTDEAFNLIKDPTKTISISKSDPFYTEVMTQMTSPRQPSLFFGYPVVRQVDSDQLIPIFTCQLEHQITPTSLIIKRIAGEDYIVQRSVFRLAGITDPEETEAAASEIMALPTLNERIECLISKYKPDIPSSGPGLIYLNEPSDFNRSVITELSNLSGSQHQSVLKSTPAKYLLGYEYSEKEIVNTKIFPIIEVFPLNNAQAESVKDSMAEMVTVVTGPPGTGKSQVVLNIFANALLNNKSVLFASKINNAVDVVNERFLRHVIDLDLLVRVGSRDHMEKAKDKLRALTEKIQRGEVKATQSDVDQVKLKIDQVRKDLVIAESDLAKLETLPTTIDEKESRLNRTMANQAEEKSLLDQKRQAFVLEKENTLHGIPSLIVQILHDGRARLDLRKKDVSDLCQTIHAYRLREGLSFLKHVTVRLFPGHYLKKISDQLTELEKGITSDLLNWIDAECPLVLSLQGFELRCLCLDRLLKYNTEIHRVFEIEEEFKQLQDKWQNNDLACEALKEKLRQEISDMKQDLERVRATEDKIRSNNARLKEEIITLSRSLVNQVWMLRLTDKGAVSHLATLRSLLDNSAAIVSAENTFTDALQQLPLWSVTSLSARRALPLKPGIFDMLVIDEAASCDIASAIPLFYRAKRVIVIGDPMQLSHVTPVSKEEDAQLAIQAGVEQYGVQFTNQSLYDRMEDVIRKASKPLIFLSDHYRSHEKIIQFSNINVYLPKFGRELTVRTLHDGNDTISPLKWVNIRGKCNGRMNPPELTKIMSILPGTIQYAQQSNYSIGITTPFRDQANAIKESIREYPAGVITADTVHKFQGDEKDIMIFSPVYSEGASLPRFRFVMNPNRPQLLNVALTRARKQLIIVGDIEACRNAGGLLRSLAIYVADHGEVVM